MDGPRRDVSELTQQIEAIVDTLATDLAETERERQKAVEREAKTAEALTEARNDLDAAKAEINRLDEVLRAEMETAVAESTDLVIDFIHNHWNTLTDVDAAKASMRPAIRDAVDAVLADLRAAERGES